MTQPGTDVMRVAVIDCGTNSIRLLVADVTSGAAGPPTLVDVHREMRVVRLGEGVDATGRLSTGAIDRTWRALADFTAILRASGAVRVRMAATSATRDAQNQDAFVLMVRSTLGQDPEVISGRDEAELSFRGAVGDLAPDPGPFLVADIGGGSTELIVGRSGAPGSAGAGPPGSAGGSGSGAVISGRVSLDLGCVRITERVLRGDPPPADQVAEATAWAERELSAGLDQLPLSGVRRTVAVSGTATTVAAAVLKLPHYDPTRIHLSRISADSIGRVATALLRQPRAHRAVLGYMHPGRVDVIGGGALILSVLTRLVAERTGISEVTISEHDILDGLALSLAPVHR